MRETGQPTFNPANFPFKICKTVINVILTNVNIVTFIIYFIPKQEVQPYISPQSLFGMKSRPKSPDQYKKKRKKYI